MKKWLLISLIMVGGSAYANDPTYDVTRGALQNNTALCGYGYNPNCSSGGYSGGSNAQYNPPMPPVLWRCEMLKNGNERCHRYYDAAHTLLESIETRTPQGKTVGEYRRYYPNGKPQAIMPYNAQGEKHGKMIFYSENGKLKSEEQFKNDLAHGLWYKYDENGKLIKVLEFSDDHLVHKQEMNGKVKHGKEEFFRLNDKGENEVYRTEEWVNGQLVK